MAKEIDPKTTKRAEAFSLWNNAPMPMITILKNLNVTNLVKVSRKRQMKFNMLLCWCIAKAASQEEDFYRLTVGGRMMEYEKIAVNIVVATEAGGITTCDVPFTEDLRQFEADYLRLTAAAAKSGQPYEARDDYMVIGTSSLAGYEIDGVVNIYAGFYNNPFLIWGKYRKKLFKYNLQVSFQFHHVQMDGIPAAAFLDQLQKEIERLQ